MVPIRLRTNLAAFRRGLTAQQQRQVPFALATAINSIATGARADLIESMKEAFDRPTPFTLNATYVKKARKSDLTAWVGIREFAGKGTPAWKYLGPQVDGGSRRQKRFERRLATLNNAAAFALPARGAELDAYGNMSRGQIVKILAAVGALGDQNETATSAKRKRKRLMHQASRGGRSPYFIARSRTGKPLAVYELKGKGRVEPVLNLTSKAPSYKPRWKPREVVLQAVQKHRVGAFERAWEHALATAKP